MRPAPDAPALLSMVAKTVGALAILMAVAVESGGDFLAPIGQRCNTLVMAPGGYRFAVGDLRAAIGKNPPCAATATQSAAA